MWVRIDRQRKMPATILFKALGLDQGPKETTEDGFETTKDFEEIKRLFGDTEAMRGTLAKDTSPSANKALIESVTKQLQNLTPEAKAAFEHWLDTRTLPEFDIEGVTVDYMKTYHHATDIGVVLAYDGLLRNPKSAYLLKRPVIKRIKQ